MARAKTLTRRAKDTNTRRSPLPLEMFSQTKRADESPLEIKLSGRISGLEYGEICKLLKAAIQKRGRVDLFCELDESFRGITLPVMWRAALTATERLLKLRRIAIVGERKGYKWARVMMRAFHAETRYFDRAHRTRAHRWLEKGTSAADAGVEHGITGDAGYRIQPRTSPNSRRQGRHRGSNNGPGSRRAS